MNKFLKIFFVIFGFLILFLILTLNSNVETISEKNYSGVYPFTIDNLILKCEDQAVWVQKDADIYPLNSKAYEKFKEHAQTDNILKINNKETEALQKMDSYLKENNIKTYYFEEIDAITKKGEKLCK